MNLLFLLIEECGQLCSLWVGLDWCLVHSCGRGCTEHVLPLNNDLLRRNPKIVRERFQPGLFLRLSLDELCAGQSELRIGLRGVLAWTQRIINQDVTSFCKSLRAVNVRSLRYNRLVRCHHVKVSSGSGRCDIQTGQVCGVLCRFEAKLGDANLRMAHPEIEGLPGEQNAGKGVPI